MERLGGNTVYQTVHNATNQQWGGPDDQCKLYHQLQHVRNVVDANDVTFYINGVKTGSYNVPVESITDEIDTQTSTSVDAGSHARGQHDSRHPVGCLDLDSARPSDPTAGIQPDRRRWAT